MLLQIDREPVVHQRFDDSLHLAVAELGLGLSLELRLRHLHADDRRQPLAHVLALQRFRVLLEEAVGDGIGIDRAGEGGLEADQMGAALDRVDVVGEGVHALGVALVPLERDLDLEAVARAVEIDDIGVNRRLRLVQVLDERDDAAFVQELVRLLITLVVDGDVQTAVQERQLAQPLREDVEAEVHGLEDERVRLEGDPRAALVRDSRLLDRRYRVTALISLGVDLAAAPHLHLERLGERIHHRDADAVQPAGDLVRSLVELPAGVKLGHHHLRCGDAFGGMQLHGDAAAVVIDGDARVDVDGDRDARALTRQRLVDGVVHDLEDEVMQPPLGGIADVHARALAYGLEALEDLDVLGAVARFGRAFPCAHRRQKRVSASKAIVARRGSRRHTGYTKKRPLLQILTAIYRRA